MEMPDNTLRGRMHAAAAEAMLDSAERAMINHGYQKATMQQIAAEAGCAPGTFYLYFKNKQELFEAIVARHMGMILQNVRASLVDVACPLERLRRMLLEMVRYSAQNVAFFQIMLSAMPMRVLAMQDQLRRIGTEKHEQLHKMMGELLQAAQDQGLIRGDLSATTLHEFVLFVSFNFNEQFANSPATLPVEERMSILWKLLTGGLGVKP